MLLSRSLISIGMISMAAYAVIVTDVRKNFRIFSSDKILVALTFIFFIYVISGINSSNSVYWIDRVRMKLPFLFMPFSFSVLKNNFSKRLYNLFLYLFFMLVSITSIVAMVQYLKQYDEVNNMYAHGSVLQTPFNHLRYSLMVAFSIFIGIYLYIQKFQLFYSFEKWVIALFTLFLIFFLHILAVRSGLIGFYIGALYGIGTSLFIKRKYKATLLSFAAIISFPVISYLTFPTMQGRLSYVIYDLHQLFQDNHAAHLSDASRILSLQKGWELTKENILTGVGIGDLNDAMRYKLDLAPQHPDYLLPLNQFLVFAAGTGIIGALIFTIIILMPFFKRINRQHSLTMIFLLISVFSLITDCALEEQIGTAFFLTFLLLFYLYNQNRDDAIAIGSNYNL